MSISNSALFAVGAICLVGMILIGSGSLINSFVPVLTHGNYDEIVNAANTRSIGAGDFQLAYNESLGFFDDIPEKEWLLKKEISKSRVHITFEEENPNPQLFYQHNWHPDFSCEMEDFIGPGGDGGKWVCDPHRIDRPGCLVYSIGSNNKFDFELFIEKNLPHCEIHIFDFTDFSSSLELWGLTNSKFHAWGLKGNDNTNNVQGVKRQEKTFKSIKETVTELGHVGKMIDIFKIDCEGCEWNSYKDWFDDSGIQLRQILVETHQAPPEANPFFWHLHEQGYVMFHKEPNIMYGGGRCVEFSFLKLSQEFFD
mmetsp:Transcript_6899/g.9884  ORF Transcript_6899/g.9884 Transcript_6899/m.9884 type:complete len:311 (-) Transcript_6899:353-1285(-)